MRLRHTEVSTYWSLDISTYWSFDILRFEHIEALTYRQIEASIYYCKSSTIHLSSRLFMLVHKFTTVYTVPLHLVWGKYTLFASSFCNNIMLSWKLPTVRPVYSRQLENANSWKIIYKLYINIQILATYKLLRKKPQVFRWCNFLS